MCLIDLKKKKKKDYYIYKCYRLKGSIKGALILLQKLYVQKLLLQFFSGVRLYDGADLTGVFPLLRSPELVDYSAPRDLHRRAAYSICESWFLIHRDVYRDLFVCS